MLPNLKSFSQDLYDRLEPLTFADPSYDYPIAKLAYAFGLMFQLVEDYGRDDLTTGAPGWANVINIDKCPDEAIPWLGQFVGVRLPGGLTPAQQRAYVKDAPGWDRGTVAAIAAAAAPYLTGQKSVTVRERFDQANPNVDSPGYYQVTTRGAETPVGDLPSTNLITNGGFETNTTGWSVYGSGTALTRDTSDAKFGLASAKFVATIAVTGIWTPSPIAVTASQTYTISAWVRAVAGTQIQLNLRESTAADAAVGADTTKLLTADGTWQRLSVTRVFGATGVNAHVIFQANNAGTTFWIDGVQLEQQSAATPYIETNGATASRPAGQGSVGAALVASKPGGLIMNYQVLVGNTYQTIYDNNTTGTILYNKYTTYQRLLDDQPG